MFDFIFGGVKINFKGVELMLTCLVLMK